ncbi:GNAT family N-acetyltransferase [uncultured Streptomyces sp.]|uniref:GNAT family N-acetyltransferase n=1 Tax=uncultured Streptomyces sp. TaxID=174707 RepID=UPI00261860A2|nr:GNAT family N-acetyltransferase [uncultured Streptomyces sp.]
MKPITLTTDRLLLRPFRSDDAEAVHTACQDAGIQRWTEIPSPYTRSDAELFVGTLAPGGWESDTAYNFALVARGTGQLVGALGVSRRVLPGLSEIGFWLVREHRGRGYGTEAVLGAARWAFGSLSVDRLEWRAEVGNTASRALAERAGFRMEGGQRSALFNKGVRRDTWVAALLPSDLGLPSTAPYVPSPAPS